MEKLSTEYEFDVTRHSVGGVTIVLTQVATGKVKVFRQAVGHAESLYSHMCSLTDSQCEQWFDQRKPKKKKPHRTQPTVVDGVSIPAVNQIVPSTLPSQSVQSLSDKA